jgi:outer membrane protein with beta-barrel domain
MLYVRVFSSFVLVLTIGVESALAQSQSRFEVGAQVSTLRLTDFDATNSGLGGRASFDLSRWLAIEGELNFFPRDRVEVESSPGPAADIRIGYSRTRFEGFAGPKIGLRRDKYGLFGKIQPGFARLTDKGVSCVDEACARMLFLLAPPEYHTEFAMNLGGVFEFYPSPRIVTRLDLGTTLIRHRSFAPPCDDCTSSNFSSRVGVGFRF